MKSDSIDNIRLDLDKEKIKYSVSVRSGDTRSRTLHATLVNGGKIVSMEHALLAEILISKADENECDQDMVISGNELQYTWRTQDINAIGENRCQIMVTFEDGTVVTSPYFDLYVYSKVINQKTQKSLNEYTALTHQVLLASEHAENASESATNAAAAENAAIFHAETAEASREAAEKAADEAENSAAEAKQLEDIVNGYAGEAKEEATKAKSSKEDAQTSAEKAKEYAEEIQSKIETADETARQYAEAAQNSASVAETSEKKALDSAKNAAAAEKVAKESAENVESFATFSKSYAVGGTGSRDNEENENAEYFYEQVKSIAKELGTVIFTVGEIYFKDLATTTLKQGCMYHISDAFTTDDRFISGSGHVYPAGTSVYVTADGMLDCFCGVFPDTWKENTSTSEGYVASGFGQSNKVWKTDENGVPDWREDEDTTYGDASTSAAGLMTAEMVEKLNGIAKGANKTTIDAALKSNSNNPVRNSVVYAEFTSVESRLTALENLIAALGYPYSQEE
jgi:chemotaxis protein histidine kinase CheA